MSEDPSMTASAGGTDAESEGAMVGGPAGLEGSGLAAVTPDMAGSGSSDAGSAGSGSVNSGSVDSGASGEVPPLWRAILIYSLIRLGLVVTLTAAIVGVGAAFSIEVPIIVALAFAMVLQLPLAVAFFRGPRNRLTAALARAKSVRTAERDRLHEQLTGEQPFD